MKKIVALAVVFALIFTIMPISVVADSGYVPKTIQLIPNNDGTCSLPANTKVYLGDTLVFPRDSMIYVGDFPVRNTDEIREMAVGVANDIQLHIDGVPIGSGWTDSWTLDNATIGNSWFWFESYAEFVTGTYTFSVINGYAIDGSEQYVFDPPKTVLEIEVLDPADYDGSDDGRDENSDMEYFISGNYAIITKYNGSATHLEIPSTLGGYPVFGIDSYAFYNCDSLVSVTIPGIVATIADYAFCDCDSLTSVTISEGVEWICGFAFAWTGLTSVTIPSSVTLIVDSAFSDCADMTEIIVDEQNQNFCSEDGVLFNKDKTKLIQYPAAKEGDSYIIPNGVETMQGQAFTFSPLSSVTIPSSLVTIEGVNMFVSTSVSEINVDEENAYFSSQDGVLFNKDKTTLIKYPAGKTDATYTTPDSVTKIGEDAFYGCYELVSVNLSNNLTEIEKSAFGNCLSLASINFPEGVTTIGDWAVSGGWSLTSVTIPSTVTTIGDGAFGSEVLETVYYNGTEQQKAQISIGAYNEDLNNATWHYFDNACDSSCNDCSTTREVPDHVYDDDSDADCNVCGEEREVVAYISGDVNGDGEINNKDLGVLRRFLNDWDVEIDELASDVNRDGDVNNKDLGILRRFLNDWDVELK